jgi:eukaryotic-like serine/threonine-protein kinase
MPTSDRVNTEFLKLTELDTAPRNAALLALHGRDPALHAELAPLLAQFEGASADAVQFAVALEPEPRAAQAVTGRAFGPYQLIEEIGRGGMGSVWRARRSDGAYELDVAIKLLAIDGSSADARAALTARFLNERQTLARLNHPNISRLLDGGVDALGQPWFALELIDGEPIDRYAARLKLDLTARLKLVLDAARAVQFAHQQLIVHRDLKPANLLVDRAGQVKLLDFGIAKLLDQVDGVALPTGANPFTADYAAPEQVAGGAIGVATDVWGLGLILDELIVGARTFARRTPFEPINRSTAITAPSKRLTALNREPDARRARGDLDTLVLRAVDLDPARRYPTVQALIDDLERYLSGRPILARPNDWTYRLSKFVRRHPLGVGLGSAAVIALITLTAVSLRAAERERAAAALAESRRAAVIAESARLNALQDRFAGVFNRAAASKAPIDSATLADWLAESSAGVDPKVQASVRLAVAEMHAIRGDFPRATAALEALAPALQVLTLPEQVRWSETLASTYVRIGKLDQVEAVLAQGLTAATRIEPAQPGLEALLLLVRAQWLRASGKPPAEAWATAQQVVEKLERDRDLDPQRRGAAYANAAQNALLAGAFESASGLAERALAVWQAAQLEPLGYRTTQALSGNLALLSGHPLRALAVFEALDATPAPSEIVPARAAWRLSLARTRSVLADHAAAMSIAAEAAEQFCEAVGASVPDCARIQLGAAEVSVMAGAFGRAEAALAALEDAPGSATLSASIAALQTPDAATIDALSTALDQHSQGGAIAALNGQRMTLQLAEQLAAQGEVDLAQRLVNRLRALPAPAGGFDLALRKLWLGETHSTDALAEELGANHPWVQRWAALNPATPPPASPPP